MTTVRGPEIFSPALTPVTTAMPGSDIAKNVEHALSLNLPELVQCKPHDLTLSIVGGGPSIEDTYKDLAGYVVTMNGSLKWLLTKNVVPYGCALLDPRDRIADNLVAHPRVRYFVASTCAPSVFNTLKECAPILWHPSGTPEVEEVVKNATPNWSMVGGGSAMGVRWITLGYCLGFRKFHLHGLDSSFRGHNTHAYADFKDGRTNTIKAGERETSRDMLAQVADLFCTIECLSNAHQEVEIFVHGDGLLQDAYPLYSKLMPGRIHRC